MNYEIKRLWVNKSKSSKEILEKFLVSSNIRWEANTDYTIGVYEKGKLIATGSLFWNIIKCVAVFPDFQGGEVFSLLISHLINEISTRGYHSSYVYTKPASTESFFHLGFSEIARVDQDLVFLEKANIGFKNFLDNLSSAKSDSKHIGAIVMNANPFTSGHLYLAQFAASRCDLLYIFVLSEDVSAFPSNVRRELVKKGIQHLKNVVVLETGDYMVSAKTFPSYFLKESADVTTIQAKLDAKIFLKIAETLNIESRFVGEEPYSFATNLYNQAMTEVFKDKLSLIVIPRKTFGNDAISASRVRALLAEDRLEEVREIVPQTTFDFLKSKDGLRIIEGLQKGAKDE